MSASTRTFNDKPSCEAHARLLLLAATLWLFRAVDRDVDGGVDGLVRRFPPLRGYLAAVTEELPEGLTWNQACRWWNARLAEWEERHGPETLPLLRVESIASPKDRFLLALAALPMEDRTFHGVFGDLDGRANGTGVLPQTLSMILDRPGHRQATRRVQDLLKRGILVGHAGGAVGVQHRFWDLVRDDTVHREAQQNLRPSDNTTAHWDELRSETVLRALDALHGGDVDVLVVRSVAGGGIRSSLGHLAANTETGLQGLLWAEKEEFETGVASALAQALGAIAAVELKLAPGEVGMLKRPESDRVPVLVCVGESGGVAPRESERRAVVRIGRPSRAERVRFWSEQPLGGRAADKERVVDAFVLPDGHLRQLALNAMVRVRLDGRRRIRLSDLRAVATELSDHALETTATRLNGRTLGWDDLVVSEEVEGDLRRFVEHCRLREHLGAQENRPGAQGVRGLFLGPSGTGKTLAAKVIAGQLGRNIYRVDLAAVFDKYVGETEKNLDRLLSEAEQLDVVLLFDEGDAAFASRTSVQSANDRYANLETNFLLQRIEDYQGIVLITSNASDRIDNAFARRMDTTVTFAKPGAAERERIWALHLGEEVAGRVDGLDTIATAHRLTGGQIGNATRHARLLGLRSGRNVGAEEIALAVAVEYRKAGALPPSGVAEAQSPQTRADDFIRSLRTTGPRR